MIWEGFLVGKFHEKVANTPIPTLKRKVHRRRWIIFSNNNWHKIKRNITLKYCRNIIYSNNCHGIKYYFFKYKTIVTGKRVFANNIMGGAQIFLLDKAKLINQECGSMERDLLDF